MIRMISSVALFLTVLLYSFMPAAFAAAASYRAIVPPSVYVQQQTCTTNLTENVMAIQTTYEFDASNASQMPGLLCPGQYHMQITCICVSMGGCGGSSCGWSMSASDGNGNTLSGTGGHNGCFASHSNICENTSTDVWVSPFTWDTNVNGNGINISPYIESGSYTSCTISANQTKAY